MSDQSSNTETCLNCGAKTDKYGDCMTCGFARKDIEDRDRPSSNTDYPREIFLWGPELRDINPIAARAHHIATYLQRANPGYVRYVIAEEPAVIDANAERDRLAKEHDYTMRCVNDNAAYFTAEESFKKGFNARDEEVQRLGEENKQLSEKAEMCHKFARMYEDADAENKRLREALEKQFQLEWSYCETNFETAKEFADFKMSRLALKDSNG